jgi:F-type H+-transporting ATPase subunit b
MPIDWFTVVAQVINFFILVWLMKRFLYAPILHAIDEREKRIAAELEGAASKQAEAKQERDEFERKNDELLEQRDALLLQAECDAKAERDRLLREAHQAADALAARRLAALKNDARNLKEAIAHRASQEVFAIARTALEDLAGTSLEERMVYAFVRRLRELNGDVKDKLVQALESSNSPATVRTAFDLPPQERALAESAIKESLSSAAQVRFETAPGLIAGIELATDGQKVAWSIGDYLASLAREVKKLLDEKSQPDPKLASESEERMPQAENR